MSTRAAAAPIPLAPDLAGLEPLETIKSRWPMIIGVVVTIAMVVGLGRELFGSGLTGLTRMVPVSPWFYAAFALHYMSAPMGDYVIFRRLWKIPLAGLAALLKKRIANDVVLGYSGEAYFYAWARQRAQMVAAPFGAVKDVSILSAMGGNAITLGMISLALPLGIGLLTSSQLETVAGSAAVVVATSLPFLIFSKRVFSLPRRTLWWIFMVHCLRLIAGSVLIALAWHFALPTVSIGDVAVSGGRPVAGIPPPAVAEQRPSFCQLRDHIDRPGSGVVRAGGLYRCDHAADPYRADRLFQP